VEGPDYASIPSCVYTVPVLASVGLTEAKAKELGGKIKVRVNDMSDWLSIQRARAWMKPPIASLAPTLWAMPAKN